jgi:hypothetical protein
LVKVEGHRWAIENSFETAKNEFGLDHDESRSWHGWHRHISLVMLAFAMMAAIGITRTPCRPQKRTAERRRQRPQSPIAIDPMVGSEIRRIAIRLAQSRINPAHVIAWSLWRRASSRCSKSSHQTEYATVMLDVMFADQRR